MRVHARRVRMRARLRSQGTASRNSGISRRDAPRCPPSDDERTWPQWDTQCCPSKQWPAAHSQTSISWLAEGEQPHAPMPHRFVKSLVLAQQTRVATVPPDARHCCASGLVGVAVGVGPPGVVDGATVAVGAAVWSPSDSTSRQRDRAQHGNAHQQRYSPHGLSSVWTQTYTKPESSSVSFFCVFSRSTIAGGRPVWYTTAVGRRKCGHASRTPRGVAPAACKFLLGWLVGAHRQ